MEHQKPLDKINSMSHDMKSMIGDTRWYFNDMKDTEMFCSLCVNDNQLWMYTPARIIVELPQTVRCKFCNWNPKIHGVERPQHLSRNNNAGGAAGRQGELHVAVPGLRARGGGVRAAGPALDEQTSKKRPKTE